MKKGFLAIAAIGLAFNLHAQELPKTQIKDIYSGKEIAFDKAIEKGKITLISFWGTWSVHGKREVTTIARKMTDWKKQADFNFIAIAVDQQHTEDVARNYAQAQGWNFPCYIDANSVLKRSLHFDALPYIIIIDKKGKIVFTHTGYEGGPQILAKLKEFAGAGSK